jgi:hypothetical protein
MYCSPSSMHVQYTMERLCYINGAAVPEGTGFQVNTAAADERMQPADTRLWNWKLHRLGNRATHFHSISEVFINMIDSLFFTACSTTSGTIQFPSLATKRNIGYRQRLTVQNGPLGYLSFLLLVLVIPAAPFPPTLPLWAESRASPLSPILFWVSTTPSPS